VPDRGKPGLVAGLHDCGQCEPGAAVNKPACLWRYTLVRVLRGKPDNGVSNSPDRQQKYQDDRWQGSFHNGIVLGIINI
jgi:hypothetical protein